MVEEEDLPAHQVRVGQAALAHPQLVVAHPAAQPLHLRALEVIVPHLLHLNQVIQHHHTAIMEQ